MIVVAKICQLKHGKLLMHSINGDREGREGVVAREAGSTILGLRAEKIERLK